MININQIKGYYPENLHPFGSFLIREYLQCKILEIIYNSEFARSMVFMGGTCLRLIYSNNRFSEDLDFDNLGLNEDQFSDLGKVIQTGLARQGYTVEMQVIHKTAYHCKIRFPGILYQSGLSGHLEEKVLIQIDSEPQVYHYLPDLFLLNRFDVFGSIFHAPLSLLLSQKFYSILNRKRSMGRDFYDVIFLLGMNIQPDWKYLELKQSIKTPSRLLESLSNHCKPLNMDELAADVRPFLFDPDLARKISYFTTIIEQYPFTQP